MKMKIMRSLTILILTVFQMINSNTFYKMITTKKDHLMMKEGITMIQPLSKSNLMKVKLSKNMKKRIKK